MFSKKTFVQHQDPVWDANLLTLITRISLRIKCIQLVNLDKCYSGNNYLHYTLVSQKKLMATFDSGKIWICFISENAELKKHLRRFVADVSIGPCYFNTNFYANIFCCCKKKN